MTENEFREALKQSVGSTGLSSDRQMNVLARMKGEERKVRTWSKWRISLVLAAVVVMTMGAAVATEIVKYVNWEGKPVDYEPPVNDVLEKPADPLRDPIADELIKNKKLEEILLIYYPGQYNAAMSEAHRITVDSLEELAQLAGEDSLLPIPTSVPDGFTLTGSHVFFASKKGTTYRLLGEEKYQEGIRVKRYTCDPEDIYLCSYFLYFDNPKGERLNFSARMVMDYAVDSVLQADGGQANVKQVEGMDQAVHIDRGDYQFIWMRKNLPEPIAAQITILGPDDIKTPDTERHYVCLKLQINSTVCDLDTMLSSFGLKSQ